MKCEVQDCEYSTEHTNTYEIDDKIMARHLMVHLIEGLRDIAYLLDPTLRAPATADAPKGPTPARTPALVADKPATPVSAPAVSSEKQ